MTETFSEPEVFAVIRENVIERLSGEVLASGLPLNVWSGALAASMVVKSGNGTLFGISGINNKNAAQYIQIHDSSTVPADGAVPCIVITVPTVTNFSMSWVIPGRYFARGIVICNSSTLATKTIGSADCWFDAQYI